MMRVVSCVLMLLVTLIAPASLAQPFTRMLWYEVTSESRQDLDSDTATVFSVPASRWWRLRVQHKERDSHPATAPELWSSAGEGVLIGHQPVDAHHSPDYTDYFYQPNTFQPRRLWLTSDATSNAHVRVFHSATEAIPSHTDDAQIVFNEDYDSVTLRRNEGFEAHDYQVLEAGQDYVKAFAEPGLYHLELRIPWYAHYQLREVVALRATGASAGSGRELRYAAQLDTESTYKGSSDATPELLSRALFVPFYVREAEQEIRVQVDRYAYLRWLAVDTTEQFLFAHNAPRETAQAQLRQAAHEPSAPVTTTFYRALPPQAPLPITAFVPLTGELKHDDARETFLPTPSQPTREPEYYYQLSAGQSATFVLPQQTENAPVRLALQHPKATGAVVVRSDSGETQHVRLQPDDALNDNLDERFNTSWQLDNGSVLALRSGSGQVQRTVTEFELPFHQPYRRLTVTNEGTHPTWVRLSYRNAQVVAPSEYQWLYLSDTSEALALRQALSSTSYVKAPALAGQSALQYEVTQQWRPRLQARAAQFAERYASAYFGNDTQLSAADFASIRDDLMTTFNVRLTTLADVYEHIMALGYNFTARQLLVDFAVSAKGDLQQQAEALLLALFTGHERWFDVEGYWAWRLYHRGDTEALSHIATSWQYQGREREAAQLAYLLGSETLATDWRTRPVTGWVKQPPQLSGNSREALIYNQDLQQYLSAFYLPGNEPVSMSLSAIPLNTTQQESAQAQPVRVKVTLYPKLPDTESTTSVTAAQKLLQQATITVNEQQYPMAIRLDRASESLSWAQDDDALVGLPQSFIFTLEPATAHQLQLQTEGFDAAVVVETVTEANATSVAPATSQLTLRLHEMALQQQYATLNDAQLKKLKADIQPQRISDEQQYLIDRLLADYSWQRLDTVSASNGIAFLESDRWQPTAPWWQLRQALMLSEVAAGERRLANDETAEIAVELSTPKQLTLELRKVAELTAPASPVPVRIATPAGEHQVRVPEQGYRQTLYLEAGRQLVSLSYAAPSEAMVLYRLLDEDGVSVLPPTSVKTFRASAEQPIELFVPGNNLLRIDQYQQRGGEASHRYQWFAEDTFFNVRHEQDEPGEFSYYRFFIWQQQPQRTMTPALPAEFTGVSSAPPSAAPTIWPVDPQRTVSADTLYELGEQEDGSWGFELGARARNNFDEDIRSAREEFIDARWNYRRHLPDWDSYWHSSLQWRDHNSTQLQTLVSQNELYWMPNKYFDAEANLDLYYQADAPTSDVEGAWAAYASLSGRWKYYWNHRTRNELELSVYGRDSSEQATPATPIDDDIVTRYKLNHRYGLSVRDQFSYHPWLDTRVHLSAQLRFNEFDDGQLLDQWSVETGWRQYYQPWRFGVDVRYRRYLQDDHRVRGLSAMQLGFSVDYELWQTRGSLWQFSFDLRHDMNRNSTGAYLGISWNATDGQGYDDFAPNNLLFAPLRQRHSLTEIDTNDITINDPWEAAGDD
ncbi:hypothetical protein [Pseudidiomarina insulisalsae]|uniref:Uncharacterized protein n=1 Tax=Pseudidiomarina insulisalsae TaxID=575789 RepID=A0A432YQQ8_9GAMM|nr:hypothetical protein [Pseudidiomarina insulisalsae]RUO63654.1 hypothetical protein CWI71_00895 [Pseudidiomarina insulisalsae]